MTNISYICTLNFIYMNVIVLSDLQGVRADLLPLTYTRPIADIRIGIDTVADKWRRLSDTDVYFNPEAEYLKELFGTPPAGDNRNFVYVAENIIPTPEIAEAVAALDDNTTLLASGNVIARRGDGTTSVEFGGTVTAFRMLYDIFLLNAEVIAADFRHITKGRVSQSVSGTNTVIGNADLIFIEEGAYVEGAFINTLQGPVYIGKNVEIMEGSMLRGPIAVGDNSHVNMGTKIYPGTTIGPWCKVGGELNNVVMQAYSNKGHDGFLGNALVGEWCNIGAGAVASNLKNDYTLIKLWNYPKARFLRTNLQHCGLIMADHSKAGINTMFNTATVLGVGVNIHGSGFPRNFVPSFSEGSTAGYTDVSMTKFFDTAQRMMARRGVELTDAHRRMFMAIRTAAEEFK